MEEEKAISSYFQLIYEQLITLEQALPWADQVALYQFLLLQMDFRFLKMFCLCVESLDYPTEKDSMFTSLKVMWPEEHKGLYLLNRLSEKWSFNIQVFYSASFALEATIQESKQQIEGWCDSLLHSSIQCKSLDYFEICKFLQDNLDDFSSYRAAEIVPLKKQIKFLKAKIVNLERSLKNIQHCPNTKKMHQFLNFIRVFVNKVACLTCLYWEKEANEENATKMNIFLVDTLHMFIPYATDVIPLYIGFLKAYDLQQSDSFHHGEAIEGFVDFFFDHLVIVLKDDFQILRDRLVFLFTFLIEPPCVTSEEDSIHSQIYDLFHENAYLLLPINVINDDFLGQKMLLTDFTMKIDIVNVEIKHLYSGFSDSQIRLEAEKIDHIYFLPVEKELSLIERDAQSVNMDQLKSYKMELRFLRMFLLCFVTLDETDEEARVRLSSMITSLQKIWEKEEEKGLIAPRLHEMRRGDITSWHLLSFELEEKIQLSKLEFKTWWVNSFHLSFQCKPSTSYKIMKFMDFVIGNLNDLVTYKALEIVVFRKQIETLKEKLTFLTNFLGLTVNCLYSKELGEFKLLAQAFVNDAACLTFMYWAKDANDKIASETNSMLSLMLQKINLVTSDVARVYFGTLQAVCVQRSDPLMFGHTLLNFVDLLIEDLMTTLKDDFHVLQDNIVFLLTFLNDPPNANVEELICSQIDVLFWEGLYGLMPFGDMEWDFSKNKMLLSDFMMKIETVNASIRQIYCKFPDSSLYNFPTVVSPRFLDFLIQNLGNLEERMISDRKYVPFAKHKITKIKEELITLCPYFNNIFEWQNELKETWFEVVNVVHLSEYVISSCISSWFVLDYSIWYHMAYFSDVFDKIKVVNTKLKEVQKYTMSNARSLPRSSSFVSTHSEQVRSSKVNEIVVGFEDEAEKVIGNLIRGPMSLDVISIVGMGGLGKTTLAKKVYSSSFVKGNFDILAFCSVSQDNNTRRLLLDILCDIERVDGIFDMTNDDLAHQLWKCLSRQKYLIVLDDIWDISAWNKVKNSFPNDKNGSRIMFTTRSHEVAGKCKINCNLHHLRFMSEAESWELLQKKVFQDGISPPHLFEVGKLIAKNCKGLPLAICVIAGLLTRMDGSLSRWSEISENLVSYLSEEGCMKILEISYNHLPEYLKPCLLYLGAFPEDSLIKVKHVMWLWISEGFVQESKTKSIDDVAQEYFLELVDRSLIIVRGNSSDGVIKTFCVHDVIHDLCQTKCRDGNFFHLRHRIASFRSLDPSLYNHYRVSTQRKSDITYDSRRSFPNIRSLLYFYGNFDDTNRGFPLKEYRLAQVLDLSHMCLDDVEQLSFIVHVRHIDASLKLKSIYIPSSISNLWNIGSLTLAAFGNLYLPETFWKMKSLRHVKINNCILKFSDGREEHESCPKLDKVVSFSKPVLSSGKDLQQLLQRLPVVRKLGCYFKKSIDHDKESPETLDFYRKLESLKLTHVMKSIPYLINFPSTLKKLTITEFQLPWTAISAIADLHCLQVLKLKHILFPGPRLDMEDMTFKNLKFFALYCSDLVKWNASCESLPCLEQLDIRCQKLADLPLGFGEIPTLKRIVVNYPSQVVENSALRIKEEQMELGIKVDVFIFNGSSEISNMQEDFVTLYDLIRRDF